jgi:DNA mismatch repair ATPase MutS
MDIEKIRYRADIVEFFTKNQDLLNKLEEV